MSKDEAYPRVRKLNIAGFIVKAHYTPQEVVEIINNVLSDIPYTESKQ